MFVCLSNQAFPQLSNFDSSYVIASSPDFDYRNPSFNTHDRNDFGSQNDCIVYEKHSANGSNIIARIFNYAGYDDEVSITFDTSITNINPSISYTKSQWWNFKSIIVWQSNKNGNWDIYYATKDSGSGWSSPTLLPLTSQDEINPRIIRVDEWLNRFYLIYERDNEVYLKHYNAITSQWGPDSCITSNVTQACTNPFFFESTSMRAAYVLHDLDSISKISSININYDTTNNLFVTGSINTNQTPNSQVSPSTQFLFKKVYSYEYDTLGGSKVIFCDGNYNNKEIMSPELAGNYFSGRASFHFDITDGSYYFSAYGVIRKNLDSTFIYAGSGYFSILNDTNFYIGDSNVNTRLAISEPILGINSYYKIRLVWEQEINGRTALVESHMVDFGTGINHLNGSLPNKFTLHQNYPNPFNPVTQIRFEIPKQGNVNLKVFDVMGREVAELVKGNLQPGVYEYKFDGTGLGSGVYFYKLQSGEFTETRRMVLVK